jgi:hypothetical protein
MALAAVACGELDSPEPETGTMMLLFGPDTVFVSIPSGDVLGGPIVLDQDLTFGAAFFTSDGEADERVAEPRFRLDAAPVDTTLVRFTRGTAFTGTLERRAPGQTDIHFGLYDNDVLGHVFNAVVPFTIN